jgi:phenylpyruvate tautomerase PptA (4-oxalocrotonate tautomerase family)
MPILTVEIVAAPSQKISDTLASQLAHRAGQIFSSAPGSTWVKLYTIPQAHYAENGQEAAAVRPIFVSILKANLPDETEMAREVQELTTAVAQLCQHPPENVHIIYLPAASGRVAFGGQIVVAMAGAADGD